MSDLLKLQGVHTHIGQYHILHGVDLAIPRGAVQHAAAGLAHSVRGARSNTAPGPPRPPEEGEPGARRPGRRHRPAGEDVGRVMHA